MELGLELPLPGFMSLTSTVPAAVPLLFHNSTPLDPSLAVKHKVLPAAVSEAGFTLNCFTSTVPVAVPSLFHKPLWSTKERVLPTTVRELGPAPTVPGEISLTSTVPAAVPSLFHNSVPVEPSLAEK